LATPVTAGTFTVNGKQITVATTDTLQSVFDQISSATGGSVTASYSSASDKITLSGAGEIILGSATDTSNFLQAAKLSNNGSGTISSTTQLGAVRLGGTLDQANFATPVSDGGSGAGAFIINGVTINYSASSDSVANIISRINDSAAGVTAAYDATNNRFTLTNKVTGDIGIAAEDVTGNFLAATGLAGGTLAHGTNLLYSVNGGGQLSSQSNVITDASSGLTGLSVTASGTGTFNITVASDTATIKQAITDFVDQYNKVQSLINTQTASTTDATGKVTAGILSGDPDANSINTQLRNLMTSTVSGLSGTLQRLDSLGFSSNGNDDSLSTTDLAGLDDALNTNLSSLKELFTNSTNGLAVQLNSFLDGTIGDNGTLVSHQDSLTHQSAAIDTQISDKERWVLEYQQQLTDSFIAMETAQAKINQQLSYLNQYFGNGSSSSSSSGG
jgi:flagellar hook-associated protein 2